MGETQRGPIPESEVPRLSKEQMSNFSLNWGPGVQGREPMPQEIFVQMGGAAEGKNRISPKDMAEAQSWKEAFAEFDRVWPGALDASVEKWGADEADKAGLRAFLEKYRDNVKDYALIKVLQGNGSDSIEEDMGWYLNATAEEIWPKEKARQEKGV